MKRLMPDTKILILTGDAALPDISSGKTVRHACPPGYSVGAIVRRRDWNDPHMFGVFGEAVFVDMTAGDVRFVDETEGLSCTVLKNNRMRCVARIQGRKVIWM